ncbi:hypothetical protein BXY41_10453 [Lacrimispora xylanisolvens]|uniref:Ricin-type beta-trefoil lectin protein n=1 Tax=Lacrimispora xylanisolvens TaxID=384636 RepID=A0A2S6HU23_9FIRM|nr:hypothetical protein [Hungatella xylanolytica]PPK81254.1 hypothetical protein BXY41_10453 [Hungatella xylanolytica]
MNLIKRSKKFFAILLTLVFIFSLSSATFAESTNHIVYDDYCLTTTEWNSGGWGNPNDVYNLVLNDNDNYQFSIIKRKGKWTNEGSMRLVRISDNKVMWRAIQHTSSDWYVHTLSGEKLNSTYHVDDGDYRLTYGYGSPSSGSNWNMYYSKIIRVTHAKK